jgi:hypothetical protein
MSTVANSTSRSTTAYPSGVLQFTSSFQCVRVARSFVFCFLWTIVCPFILFFFYQMYRLSIFDSWLLIISVVLYPKTFILSYPSIIILSLSVIDKSGLTISQWWTDNFSMTDWWLINDWLMIWKKRSGDCQLTDWWFVNVRLVIYQWQTKII